MDKQYIGDGLYIQEGSYHGEIILTTEDGISIQNTIHIDVLGLACINRYVASVDRKIKNAEDRALKIVSPEKCPDCKGGTLVLSFDGGSMECNICSYSRDL